LVFDFLESTSDSLSKLTPRVFFTLSQRFARFTNSLRKF